MESEEEEEEDHDCEQEDELADEEGDVSGLFHAPVAEMILSDIEKSPRSNSLEVISLLSMEILRRISSF